MTWKTLDDMEIAGKIVLTRVDINVPVEEGRVTDATRIERIVPTVERHPRQGRQAGAAGAFRPAQGQTGAGDEPAGDAAGAGGKAGPAGAFIERPTRAEIDALPAGTVVLLENTRFSPMEETNDPQMAEASPRWAMSIATMPFPPSHRAHASTEGVAHHLPPAPGARWRRSFRRWKRRSATRAPRRGGGGRRQGLHQARPSGQLVGRVDHLIIGGGMANTFLAAQGIDVGKSLAEHDMAATARTILKRPRAAAAPCTCRSISSWRATSPRTPRARPCPSTPAPPMR